MASPHIQAVVSSNNENAPPNVDAKTIQQQNHERPSRPVLGGLSPNAKVNAPIAELLKKKQMISSPLKRSYTASVDSPHGFTYLKKRKFSQDVAFSKEGRESVQAMDPHPQFRPSMRETQVETPEINVEYEATPTEPNTPSDDGEANSIRGSSAERASFSSWINYDTSSQQATASQHREDVLCKAGMLRIRLQLAMYKVRTNQTSRSFAEISITEEEDEPKSTQGAIEEAVAALRREAQQTPYLHDQPVSTLRLGFPVLKPTPYSSRHLSAQYYPSSPPLPENLAPIELAIPTADQQAAPHLCSSPGSPKAINVCLKQEVTSSAVKGQAAGYLLGLRNAA